MLLLTEKLNIEVLTREPEFRRESEGCGNILLQRGKSLLSCTIMIIPPAGLPPCRDTKVCVACPLHSAGDMWGVWTILVNLSSTIGLCSKCCQSFGFALHNFGHDEAFPPPSPDGNPFSHIYWLAEENNETTNLFTLPCESALHHYTTLRTN